MKINGAIFDLDGTLVDSMIWWETIWDVVSRAHFDGKPCRPDRETEEKLHTLAVGESVKLLLDPELLLKDDDLAMLELANEENEEEGE